MTRNSNILIKWPTGEVQVQAGEYTILDALLACKVPIDHSCLRGDCRQCFARVIIQPTDSCVADDEVPLCQTKAIGGGVYELDQDPAAQTINPRLYPARVVSAERVANDIYRLLLKIPHRLKFDYRGGQFAKLRLPDGVERSYSIYSALNEHVEFLIKAVPDGRFGSWLLNGRGAGEMIQMRAPFGKFLLRDLVSTTTYFIATGTGIVPIIAMLKECTPEQAILLGRINVFWGNRTPDDIFDVVALNKICFSLGAKLEFVFSQYAPGNFARVTNLVAESDLSDSVIYVAGNPVMINDVHALWRQKKSSGRFVSDSFAHAYFSEGKNG